MTEANEVSVNTARWNSEIGQSFNMDLTASNESISQTAVSIVKSTETTSLLKLEGGAAVPLFELSRIK